jgi:hypothetical protein
MTLRRARTGEAAAALLLLVEQRTAELNSAAVTCFSKPIQQSEADRACFLAGGRVVGDPSDSQPSYPPTLNPSLLLLQLRHRQDQSLADP